MVKEFIVNIPAECDNPLSKEYQKVYVRREYVNFSPNIINKFLMIDEEGVAELEATDNQVSNEITKNKVKVWPTKGKILSGKLSVKYVILNRIGNSNWVPTHLSDIATGLAKFFYAIGIKAKMDLGRIIFDQIVKHAKTDAVRLSIAFPTLLCSIMFDQHPRLITADDLPKKREFPLTIHHKLFGDNHAPNLVGTSGSIPAAKFMTKEEIIVALKDTCVMLDERKAQLELIIHALEKEDVAVASEQEDNEEEEADDAGNEIKRMRKDLESALKLLNDFFCYAIS